MKKLLYISPLPQDSQTGGANAVNYNIFQQLKKHFNCTYKQINPPINKWEKWKSQFKRKVLKRPGDFFYFSHKRLNAIKNEFDSINEEFDYVFFRAFTPWIYCQPQIPYFTYNDIEFLQFFENTFHYQNFNKEDLNRIINAEMRFLDNAQHNFFESNWGAKQCHLHYKIDNNKLLHIGRGGEITIPRKDYYNGELILLLIANNFHQKGGDLIFKAYKYLKQHFKNLSFHIVGGDPGKEVKKMNGVFFYGKLHKENPQQLNKLESLLSNAFLLIHPTREDTNPLVITEAGYYGCPSLSVRQFAIPELVRNNKTGILLPPSPTPYQIAKAIEKLITHKHKYIKIRKQTWDFNHENFVWEKIAVNIAERILNT